jgi:beta-xylosidase
MSISNESPIPVRRTFGYPWLPDLGDGSYCNPVLYADYSDPDVVQVAGHYFLVASSFNCTPGLPILHSRDLVNWTLLGHALKNLPHPRYAEVQPGCGVWAPAIRHHAGKFWIFFPTPDEGIYMITADQPGGPWSEPHLVQAGRGLIDPCPFWDDDGQAYLVHAYAGSRAGIKHRLRVCPMAPDGTRLLGEGQVVFHEPERHPTLEGPKFLKRDGWYYLLAPAGGVENGWQVVLRSKNMYGPYEDRIVLRQGATDVNGPHQGALVSTPAGDWWFVHFQDAGLYGRVIHLQPVQWRDGWPLMGRAGEPVRQWIKPNGGSPVAVPATSDDFALPFLGLQWQWNANHEADWHSLGARPGWLRLPVRSVGQGNLVQAPNLLLQKFPARSFAVETELDFAGVSPGETAGLVVTGRSGAAVAVRRGIVGLEMVSIVDDRKQVLANLQTPRLRFRAEVAEGGLTRFFYAADQQNWHPVPEPFQAQAGVWIGARIGLLAATRETSAAGHVDFKRFQFLPLP